MSATPVLSADVEVVAFGAQRDAALDALETGSLSLESLLDVGLLTDAEFEAYLKKHGQSLPNEGFGILERARLLAALLDSERGETLLRESRVTAQFAEHFEVDVEAAAKRAGTQLRAEIVGATLRVMFPDTLADVWLHADGSEIVVEIAEYSAFPPSERSLVSEKSSESLRAIAESLAGSETLRFGSLALTERGAEQLVSAVEVAVGGGPGETLAEFDVRTNAVIIRSDLPSDEVRSKAAAVLDPLSTQAVRLEVEPHEKVSDDGNITGGLGTSGYISCTTGFVAVRGGITGILFAEHCPTQSFEGQQLTIISAADKPWGEVQISRLGTHSWTAEFYSNWTQLDPVNSVKSYNSTIVGSTYCEFGRVGGRDCGELLSKRFLPSNYPGPYPVGPGHRRYLRFAGDLSDDGDSGGPYYSGTSALGLVSGSGSSDAWASSAYYTDYYFADIKTK